MMVIATWKATDTLSSAQHALNTTSRHGPVGHARPASRHAWLRTNRACGRWNLSPVCSTELVAYALVLEEAENMFFYSRREEKRREEKRREEKRRGREEKRREEKRREDQIR